MIPINTRRFMVNVIEINYGYEYDFYNESKNNKNKIYVEKFTNDIKKLVKKYKLKLDIEIIK